MQETRDRLGRHYDTRDDATKLKHPNYKKYSDDLKSREENPEKEEVKEKGFLDKVKEKLVG